MSVLDSDSFRGYPEPHGTPMIMRVTRSMLLEVINAERMKLRLKPLPSNTTMIVRVPGGGDYSNEDLPINDDKESIFIRWKE